ncbi:MAG TPA: universal stress protein [Terriglobales bacterium]|nr:universal stress protein [Terriglobales bacterium]
MTGKEVLVILDDSPSSSRAVRYAGRIMEKSRGFRTCLVHLLPSLPPELLEHGGAQNPDKEGEVEAELKSEQEKWLGSAKKAAQQSLERAEGILRDAGQPKKSIQLLIGEAGDGKEAAERVFELAEKCKCHTIVVGRELASRLHSCFSTELPEELLLHAKGFAVWVVQ